MSFTRYPKYKDSGVEWLGKVPEHWVTPPLYLRYASDLGKMLDTSRINGDHLTKYLRNVDVQWGAINFDELPEMDIEQSEFPRYTIKSGDLLVCEGGEVGRTAIVPTFVGVIGFQKALHRLRALSHDEHPVFMFHCLRWAAEHGVFDVSGVSTIAHLTGEQLRKYRFPKPSGNEQAAIATFLDREAAKIDALVTVQLQLMDLLKEKRQAVISHAVTKGINPDVPMKPSGVEWLGDVPAHWNVIALKRIADVNTGVAKGKDNGTRATISVPYLRVANVQDGYLDLESVATIDIPAEDLDRYRLKAGDVLMNEGGDFDKLGRGHVWDGQIDPCITQNHVFAVRPREVPSEWLNAITGSDYAQFYFMTRSKQSTNLASISSKNLMELPVVLPPIDDQQRVLAFITEQTSRFDGLFVEAQRAIDLLQERRTALISAAVTGQIDVRSYAERKAA